MERLNSVREASNIDMKVTIESLKPRENIILIMKTIVDTHERFSESATYFRGFIATGTWTPIVQITAQPFPREQNAQKDAEV